MTRHTFRDKVGKKENVRVLFTMNVVLCDDNHAFMKELGLAIEKHCALRDWSCCHSCFHHAKDLLHTDLSSVHVVFLDIDMPDMNGLELARRLRRMHPDLVIVFVTAYIEYAPAGYHVDAFRYLLKSRLQTELPHCLDSVWDKLFCIQDSIQIQLVDRTSICIRVQDILFFEGTPCRHVLLHTTTSPTSLECIGKLSDYEKATASKGFLRIQKSYLVNMFQYVPYDRHPKL